MNDWSSEDDDAHAAANTLSVGALVAERYEVQHLLGRGGMGEVYAARDRELDRDVALKVLPAHRAGVSAIERFMQEARAAARVEHPGCVRVYDRGLDRGALPFVVMERLRGQTLADLLAMQGRLVPCVAIELALQVCNALAAAHRCGVIHRDLKPRNLFVEELVAGKPVRVKVLDFGLARLLDAETPITRNDQVLGTLAYLAPEQWRGAKHATPLVDVYAIGCVLFEMLAGRAPFNASTRAELELVVCHDPAPDLCQLCPDVAPALARLVRQALDKSPELRPQSCEQLAGQLAEQLHGARVEWTPPAWQPSAAVSQRFRIEGQLGAGAQGDVYAAFDQDTRQRVALKRLRQLEPEQVFRLKREFRAFSAFRHPNLVRLEQLWIDGADGFMSMELVEGTPVLDYIQGSEARLRHVLLQVAAALQALHGAGFVHRDLKAAHILVEPSGRAVVIDFGLSGLARAQTRVAGTPEYMAPEVSAGQAGPEADLYALGVVLGKAIARAPIEERSRDLAAIARALVDPDKQRRPTAAQLADGLALLAHEPSAAAGAAQHTQFVGRATELSRLRSALAQVTNGQLAIVLLRAASGAGKTALLQRFIETCGADVLVLRGSCHEAESLPFPAVDAIVDALSEYLLRVPALAASALTPQQASALLRLFPVLGRVASFTRGRTQHAVPKDPAQLRLVAYDALRLLLQRLCEQQLLVIAIDDLHWLDADSQTLLSHVLRYPDPPPLLLIGSARASAQLASTELDGLLRRLPERAQELWLPPLSISEALQLAHATGSNLSKQQLERIVQQAEGHPVSLGMLLEHAQQHPEVDDLTLARVLTDRLQRVGDGARRLLELASISAQPLPQALLIDASGAELASVASLKTGFLLRSGRSGTEATLEPYSESIRRLVADSLEPAARKQLHSLLAARLSPRAHATAAIEQLARSGDRPAAARVATLAAAEAEHALAFDRAAALLGLALEHTPPSAGEWPALVQQRIRALHYAGKSEEAGRVCLDASAHASSAQQLALRDQAGELFLSCGEVEKGLALLGPALQRHGYTLPADLPQTMQLATAAVAALQARGLEFVERTAADLPAESLRALELQLTLAQCLSHVDLRGLPFAFSALHLALDAGELQRLQKACAVFVWNTGSHLPTPLVEPVLALCRQLTPRVDTPYARALLHVADAEQHHVRSDFLTAEADCERAEHLMLVACRGVARELAGVRAGIAFLQYAQKGDFKSRVEQTLSWLADADARTDRYHANLLRSAHALLWVARDQPEKARAELLRAEAAWPGGVSAFEVGVVLFLDVVDRYEGQRDAHLHPAQGRQSVLDSPAAHTPFLKGYLCLHRGFGALAALARGEHTHSERSMAQDALTTLRALQLPIWDAVADALEANLLHLHSQNEEASRLLERSERSFRTLHMLCLAACARKRRGELARGLVGDRLAHEADAELRDLGVVDPAKWCRAYFSPFEAHSQLGALTLTGDPEATA